MLRLLPVWAILLATGVASECYFPNGDKTSDIPCYEDGRTSHCCPESALCLTNKLCLGTHPPWGLSRGSCTDKSWTNSNCPLDLCEQAQPSAGSSIVRFNGSGSDALFCCNSIVADKNDAVCSTVKKQKQTPFKLPDGSPIAGVAALSDYNKTSNSSSSSISNTTAADAATTSGPASQGQRDRSKEVAIGAGVGVPLGVISLLAIAWALWERRQRKQTLAQPPPAPLSPNHRSPGYSKVDPVQLPSSPVRLVELDGGKQPQGGQTI